jgi:MFS family permease
MVVSVFGNGIAFPMTVLIVQRWTHDRVRGRAFTLIMSVHFALLGAAMVAAGALTEAVGPRWVYVAGAAALVAAASSAFALSRGIRWEPAVARRQAA